jgi:hypothetical protein
MSDFADKVNDLILADQAKIAVLRLQIATAAMQGLLANSANTPENTAYALEAVKQADRLLYVLDSTKIGELN